MMPAGGREVVLMDAHFPNCELSIKVGGVMMSGLISWRVEEKETIEVKVGVCASDTERGG